MTPEQVEYTESAKSGKLGDLLVYLSHQMGRAGDQAYCNVNNGFLAHGRRIIETPYNRLHIKSPERCLHFGTDSMVGMIEWLGRELAKEFPGEKNSGVQLSIGDVAAPRGGCLFGKSGRRGHASHTSGQDADIGFINPLAGSSDPGPQFIKTFDAPTNWWFLKKIFKNPFDCIRVIFLDSRLIKVLEQYTNSAAPSKHGKKGRTPSKIQIKLTPQQRAELAAEWKIYHPFIRHAPGHKNHFHVRVGYGPGAPGCIPGAHPELETEEDVDSTDIDDESSILDQLTKY